MDDGTQQRLTEPGRDASIPGRAARSRAGSGTRNGGRAMSVFACMLALACGGGTTVAGPSGGGGSSSPSVSRVDVTPSNVDVSVEGTANLTVEVTTDDGEPLDRSGEWTVRDGSIAEVEGSGAERRVRGLAEGATHVVATVEGVADSASVEVSASSGPSEPTVSSVTLTPSDVTLEEGTTADLALEVTASDGSSLDRSGTWEVTDTGVARLSGSGSTRQVEGVAAGSTRVVASVDGVADTAAVEVISSSSGDVQPVFEDGFESGDVSHTENGYEWGNSVNMTVVADAARTGSHGLRLTHPAKADGDDSVAQINLNFGAQVTEVWIELWMRVPDNYFHRDSEGADNNKFFQIYGDSRKNPDVGIIAEVQHWVGEGDSDGIRYLPHETGDIEGSQWREHKDVEPILQSEQGQWIRWRWHIKTSEETSTEGPWDGIVEVWKGSRLLFSDTGVPIRNDDPNRQDGMDIMRLLGWSNSGYDEDTSFDFDDLKIYTSNPGW